MKRTPIARKTALKPGTKRMRNGRPKMTPARARANGKPCLVRYPGGCQDGRGKVVLAHYRLDTGGGQKPHDDDGAFACDYCHDVADGRRPPPPGYTYNDVRLGHAEGVLRTQAYNRAGEGLL